jgi:hypothetical protein
MAPKPERKPDNPAQYQRFLEAAHKAGAEESEEAADKAFKKITSTPKQKQSKQRG